MSHPIILFDGDCPLCHAVVRFVIRRDRHASFRFASLQSDVGQRLLRKCGLAGEEKHGEGNDDDISGRDGTFVLIEGGQCYTRSTAALRIFRRLTGGWPLAYGLIIVPRKWRDAVYNVVSRNRFRFLRSDDPFPITFEDLQQRMLH